MSDPLSGPSRIDGAISILVCDDNAAVREMLCIILDESEGLRVVGQATDGNEAVAEATRLQPDVIVLDLAMPRRSGLDALPELIQAAPDAKVVVLTGFAGSAVAESVFALGAARLIEKGTTPSAIVATILEVACGLAVGSDMPAP
ncbi:MAG TPA: response regulator transcription factor [Gaiellaceae bacterium]|nr:response regulator transcription factor [Gaiellaceae bacterium]